MTLDNKHIILREAYRNYLTFQEFVGSSGKDVIEYSVPAGEGSDEWVPVAISFTGLERALKTYSDHTKVNGTVLAKRKEQAFYLNVLRDMKQKDVAELMGITTVSVGQYVEQAMLQLCDCYFAERTLLNTDDQGDE